MLPSFEMRKKQTKTRKHTQLHQMATHSVFLGALRAFKRRRAYANLEGDFLVPFGTAAFEVKNEK
jgi:hypothetical protein